jgi:hypothetical protein
MRVPECEILMPTHAVKNFIRNREFFKILSSLETGAEHGMWSFQRYRSWLEARKTWHIPDQNVEPPDSEPQETSAASILAPLTNALKKAGRPERKVETSVGLPTNEPPGIIEIDPTESEFGKILKRPGEK